MCHVTTNNSPAHARRHLVMPRFFQQVPEGSTGPQAAKHSAAAGRLLAVKWAMPDWMQRGREGGWEQRVQEGEVGDARGRNGRRRRRSRGGRRRRGRGREGGVEG